MRQTKQTAVGRYAARGKQYIVQLRPVPGGLVMQQLLYEPEVRTIEDIEVEEAPVKDNELALAKQLVETLSAETFDASRYNDDYRTALLEAIDRKVAGEEITAPPKPQAREQIIDLVAALKKSIAEKRQPAFTGA